jgi:hypothetical protein
MKPPASSMSSARWTRGSSTPCRCCNSCNSDGLACLTSPVSRRSRPPYISPDGRRDGEPTDGGYCLISFSSVEGNREWYRVMLRAGQGSFSFRCARSDRCRPGRALVYRASFVIDGERYFSLFDDAMISMRYANYLMDGRLCKPTLDFVHASASPSADTRVEARSLHPDHFGPPVAGESLLRETDGRGPVALEHSAEPGRSVPHCVLPSQQQLEPAGKGGRIADAPDQHCDLGGVAHLQFARSRGTGRSRFAGRARTPRDCKCEPASLDTGLPNIRVAQGKTHGARPQDRPRMLTR